MPEITAKGAGANGWRAASASRSGNSSHSDPNTRPTKTCSLTSKARRRLLAHSKHGFAHDDCAAKPPRSPAPANQRIWFVSNPA